MLTTELIERILATIPQRTVGVLGDLFLDRYLDIDPALDEPSVETGKTAYQVVKVRSYPGANAASPLPPAQQPTSHARRGDQQQDHRRRHSLSQPRRRNQV